MKITVITADIIQSRAKGHAVASLPERLSELKHSQLLAGFAMSRGDEIQGVLSGWLTAPEVIRLLRYTCRPLHLRVGIGLGVHEGRLERNPWDLTGPAFFGARSALDDLKRSRRVKTKVVTGGANELDRLLNAIMLLLDTVEMNWTEAQWEAVHVYEALGTYAAAGDKLGVAAQNVHKRCQAAHWNAVREAENALRAAAKLLSP
ncbi:MAG: hypothetical protein GX986_09470 [Firmicutes bacterium]|nr:hypothetical protein [Bacillota bacterium]